MCEIIINHSRTIHSQDICFDHNSVVTTFRLTLKRLKQSQKSQSIDIEKLKNTKTREKVKTRINNELEVACNTEIASESINNQCKYKKYDSGNKQVGNQAIT